MEQVNIYIEDNFKGFQEQDGAVAFVIETIQKGVPFTLDEIRGLQRETPNQATMTGLILAVARLRRSCELDIYTENSYMAAGVTDWMSTWRENNWMTSRGKTVENIAEWQILDALLSRHKYRLHVKEPHSYKKWLQDKLDNYEVGGTE